MPLVGLTGGPYISSAEVKGSRRGHGVVPALRKRHWRRASSLHVSPLLFKLFPALKGLAFHPIWCHYGPMRHSASRPLRIHTHDHHRRRLATSTAAAATAPDLALQQIQKPAHQRTTPAWLDMEAGSRILALLTIYCPPLGFRLNNQPPYRGLLLTAYSHHALRPHRNRRAPASH